MPFAERSLAIDVLDRTIRGVVGLVVGTALGALVAELIGTLLAFAWAAPTVWALWAGCAGGVLLAAWSAMHCRWPWFTPVGGRHRSRRATLTEHGWVDFVVRAALGVCAGAVAGVLTASALLVWLAAFGVDVDADADGYGSLGYGSFAIMVFGFLLGALFGFVWFAVDLPWLPGHRRPRDVGARADR